MCTSLRVAAPPALALCALVAFGCQAPGESERGEPPVGMIESSLVVCAAGPTVQGVDVSHWQGVIDWGKVKAAGIEFAFFKATEHTMFFDGQFDNNWKNSRANGVIRGAYHFYRPSYDPLIQAEWFVQKAGVPGDGDLPPTLDLEVTDNLAPADVAKGALQFLARVELLTGRVPMIYTSNRVFNTVLGGPAGFAKYPLWVANWNVMCPNIPDPTWKSWRFWQTTDSGAVNGIAGKVDLDAWNGTLADLKKFAAVAPKPGSDLSTVTDLAPPADLSRAGDLEGPRDLLAATDGAAAPVDQAIGQAIDQATGADAPVNPGAVVSGCDVGGRRASNPPVAIALLALGLAALRRRRTTRAS